MSFGQKNKINFLSHWIEMKKKIINKNKQAECQESRGLESIQYLRSLWLFIIEKKKNLNKKKTSSPVLKSIQISSDVALFPFFTLHSSSTISQKLITDSNFFRIYFFVIFSMIEVESLIDPFDWLKMTKLPQYNTEKKRIKKKFSWVSYMSE